MTRSQYYNIIKHNLSLEYEFINRESIFVVNIILNTLASPLPNGDYEEVILSLAENHNLAWRECSMNEAQNHAEQGIPAIGIFHRRVVIIIPDIDINALPDDIYAPIYSNEYARPISQLLPDEREQMLFFVYSK